MDRNIAERFRARSRCEITLIYRTVYGDSAIKEKEKEKEEKKETAELESGSAGQQDRRPAGGKIFRRAAPDTPLRLRL